MNTILITGTYHSNYEPSGDGKTYLVYYDIIIWGSRFGMPLKYVTHRIIICTGYTDLWRIVKPICVDWFDEPKMDDGAYTQFLEHLIPKP